MIILLILPLSANAEGEILGFRINVQWTDDGTYITCAKKMTYPQAKTCYWKVCEGDIGTVPMGAGTYKFCARMKALMKKRNDYRIPGTGR